MLSRPRVVHSLDPPLVYPGLLVRITVFLADFALLAAVDLAVFFHLGFAIGRALEDMDDAFQLVREALRLVVRALYYVLWESSRHGATLGRTRSTMPSVERLARRV